jgi:uncharacterized protein YndB with AHSA1/START domain
MARIAGEIIINRPVPEVFDFVADERNEPRYNRRLRNVAQISAGPIGRGTRFRAETVTMGRTAGMVIEYTEFQRPRRLGSSTRMPAMEIDGDLTFDPVPGGTRMRWSWQMRPLGALRLLGPALTALGRRQEESCWAGLKRHLEGAGPAGEGDR